MARVLYLYSQALRANTPHARRTFQMLALLRDAGFTADLLTLPGGDPWPQGLTEHIYVTSPIPFIRSLPPYGFGFRRAWATLAMALTAIRLSLQHRYDIVHCSDRAIRIGGLISWMFGTKFTFEWRSTSGHDLVKWAKWRSKKFREMVNLVITDLPYSVPQLRESGLYGKIASIQSLPLPTLSPLPPPAIRTRPAAQPFRLTAFSYTSDLSDLSLFYEALPKILQAQNIQITISGGSSSALERQYHTLLHRFPKSHGRLQMRATPSNFVEFTDLITNTDLVFLPVCQGVVAPPLLLDLMACGRALLVIRCPAYETLLNHQNAALINADSHQIAENIQYHLNSTMLCAEHAINAAETIEKECNPRSAVAALRSCYAFILLEPDK